MPFSSVLLVLNASIEAGRERQIGNKGTCLVCVLCLETLEEVKSLLLGGFCYGHGYCGCVERNARRWKDDGVRDDAITAPPIKAVNANERGMKCT